MSRPTRKRGRLLRMRARKKTKFLERNDIELPTERERDTYILQLRIEEEGEHSYLANSHGPRLGCFCFATYSTYFAQSRSSHSHQQIHLILFLTLTLANPTIPMSHQDPVAEHSASLCEQFNKDPKIILDLARSFGGQEKSLVSAQIIEISQSGFLLSTKDANGRQFEIKVTSSRSMHSISQVHDMFAMLTTKSSQSTRKVR